MKTRRGRSSKRAKRECALAELKAAGIEIATLNAIGGQREPSKKEDALAKLKTAGKEVAKERGRRRNPRPTRTDREFMKMEAQERLAGSSIMGEVEGVDNHDVALKMEK